MVSQCMISCLYHSPSTSDSEFLVDLKELMKPMDQKKGNLFLYGDFNIDMSKYTFYSIKHKIKMISECGLYQK